MTPLSQAATELRLVVQRAEDRSDRAAPGANADDFRTETLADLMDAMDRIDMGLGTRLMLVLYPHCDAQGATKPSTPFNPKGVELLTCRDALDPAMAITDRADAQQYLRAYVVYLQACLAREPRNDGMTAEQIARINLGCWAGYYSHETRQRVERLFDCAHPIFGKASAGMPTPQQAFDAGWAKGAGAAS